MKYSNEISISCLENKQYKVVNKSEMILGIIMGSIFEATGVVTFLVINYSQVTNTYKH